VTLSNFPILIVVCALIDYGTGAIANGTALC